MRIFPDSPVRFRPWLVALLAAGCLSAGTGCRTCRTMVNHYQMPDYVVTADFYREAPQHIAVLPFAGREESLLAQQKADTCRRVFYQHLSVRDFATMSLRDCDRLLASTWSLPESERHTWFLLKWIRFVDAFGMTSVLDLHTVLTGDPLRNEEFASLVDMAGDTLRTDACLAGVTRSYGRIYAVVVSSISIGTRVELRSTRTGRLLWRGQDNRRNYEIAFTLNPLDIPFYLFHTWRNSRGRELDQLAYETYGELDRTIPYVDRPSLATVVTLSNTTIHARPSTLAFRHRLRVPAGTRLPFVMEQNGWYQCVRPDGRVGWVLTSEARLELEPLGIREPVARVQPDHPAGHP